MEPSLRSITWEAPEHHHVEKGNDWFFALIIIVLSLVVVAILFNDTLFALLIGLAGGALAISAAKRPSIVPYAVTTRSVKIEDHLYPYSMLESDYIDDDDPRGPQLFLKAGSRFMPLIIMPIPSDHVDDIEGILAERLPQEHLEESIFVKVLELFGF